jgi:NTE family protein
MLGLTEVGARQRGRAADQERKYGIAFVLSGGAARGAIQVGMLQVLLERGIVPDLIVGTSVGAFNGAWLAGRPSSQGMRELERVWSGVRFADIFPDGPVGVLVHLVRRQPSLYGGDGIRRFLERTAIEGGFGQSSFEDFGIPLAVVSTNLTRGRPEIFDSGPLLPALLASAAIPAVLPPVTINGEQYVDGGLLDNVGLRVAIERGAGRIYVLDTSWEGAAAKPAASLDSVIERSLQVVMAFHLQSALEYYSQRAEVVVLRADGAIAQSTNDFRATRELIAAGRLVAGRVLAAPERESERAIRRRRAALWPSWPRPLNAEAWTRGAHLRQVFAASTLSLPERLKLFARSLSAEDSPRSPARYETTERRRPEPPQAAAGVTAPGSATGARGSGTPTRARW